MKKLALLMAVLFVVACVSSSAFATDYNFKVATGIWRAGTSWDNGGVGGLYPTSNTDTAFLGGVGAKILNISAETGNNFTLTTGQLVIDNGSKLTISGMTFTIVTDATGGKSGNFLYKSATGPTGNSSTNFTYDVGGNFYFPTSAGYLNGNGGTGLIIMRGNNKYISDGNYVQSAAGTMDPDILVYGTGVYDNVSNYGGWYSVRHTTRVMSGGSIGANPAGASTWVARRFIFDGGQANLPALHANVNFIFAGAFDDNNTKRLAVTGGVVYPQDVSVGMNYWGSGSLRKNPYVFRMKGGDLNVGRSLYVYSWSGNSAGESWFTTEDNDTGAFRNVTVHQDFNTSGTATEKYLTKFNSSTVKIDGSLKVTTTDGAAVDFGSATVRVGQDFQFTGGAPLGAFPQANWNPGTSTVICDGNGTVKHYTQTLRLYGDCGIALNNLLVNNFGGTVQLFNGLGGALRLKGNLEIDNGTFTGNKQNIIFNGPSHKITNLVNPGTYQFDDNINLLASSVLALGSQITIKPGDNLNMGAGSIIYLCGFTLKADGKTYDGALTGTSWTNDGGTIFALSNVPEPATLLLLGTGAMGVVGWMRRRKMS